MKTWTSVVLQNVFSSSARISPSVVATLRDLHCHLPGTRCSELPCRSRASSSRAAPTLPSRLLPRSWRSGLAFLLSRLPPSASAVVAPLRNLGKLPSSLAMRLARRMTGIEACCFCCLLWASSACSSTFCRNLLLHRSDGFFRHRHPEVSGKRCLPNDSTPSVRGPNQLRFHVK